MRCSIQQNERPNQAKSTSSGVPPLEDCCRDTRQLPFKLLFRASDRTYPRSKASNRMRFGRRRTLPVWSVLGSWLYCASFTATTTNLASTASAFFFAVPVVPSLAQRCRTVNRSLWLSNHDGDSSSSTGSEDDEVVTKEMFLRDMLQPPADEEAIVKKKRKKGSHKEYKVMDNRDRLPFSITVQTPDPYTHPDVKKKNAVVPKKTRRDAIEDQIMIASSVYRTNGASTTSESSSDMTWLGEFSLDKYTTTGDSIILPQSGVEYKVVRHRCLYKYGGGQRFVLVRKILEVKEVGRLLSEQYLQRQWQNSNGSGSTGNSSATQVLTERGEGLA
jgi:hypothetical protein